MTLFTDIWWLPALLSGMLLAAITGPLGSFVVWRRMAFFGDTLAHGALLGITFGIVAELDPVLALMLSSVVLALLLYPLQKTSALSADTLLGIVSHSMLAIGLVTLSLTDNVRVDLMGYLFGDLLAVDYTDTLWIALTGIVCITLMVSQWRGLVATTVSQELAEIDGYPVQRLNLMLVIILALTVALAMKIVGILLVSALLIIPAASARALARTPEHMAMMASALGVLAVIAGMAASFQWDTPTGPSVVVAATSIFVASLLVKKS